jgi:hypothetical protein
MAKGSRRRRGLGGAITIAEKCLKRVNRRDQAKGSAVQRSHVFSHRRKGRNRRRRAGRRGQAAMQRTRRNVVIRAQCKVSRPVRQGSGQWAVVVRETALVIGKLLCWVLCTSDRGIEAKRRKGIEDLVEGEREEPSLRRCGLAPPLLVPRREGGPKRSCLPGQSQSPHRSLQNRVTGFGCNNFSSIASSARG